MRVSFGPTSVHSFWTILFFKENRTISTLRSFQDNWIWSGARLKVCRLQKSKVWREILSFTSHGNALIVRHSKTCCREPVKNKTVSIENHYIRQTELMGLLSTRASSRIISWEKIFPGTVKFTGLVELRWCERCSVKHGSIVSVETASTSEEKN